MELALSQIDIVFLIIIIIAMIRGAFRGFVAEFLGMAAIILGIAVAVLFSSRLAVLLTDLIGDSMWVNVIAFLGIFVVTYLAVKLIEGALHSAIEKLNLHKLDRVLGFLLGAVEGILVVCVALLIIQIQPFFDTHKLMAESFFAGILMDFLIPATAWLDDRRV